MKKLFISIFLSILRQTVCEDISSTTEYSTTWGHLTIPPEWNVTAELINARIIPDAISKAPEWAVKVRYGYDGVNFGNHLNRIKLKKLPSFVNWNKKPGHFYTIVMTGLDAPSREKPLYREFQHWLVTNIPARISGVKEGDTLTEYKVELTSFYAEGDHRIVYFMFEQPTKEKLIFNEHRIHTGSDDILRSNFSTEAFAKKYNLKIIGANYLTLDFHRFKPLPDYLDHEPDCMPDKIIPFD